MHKLPLAPFCQHTDLRVVTPEVPYAGPAGTTAEYRAGDYPVFTVFQLSCRELVQTGANARSNQTGAFHLWPRQCHNPGWIETTRQKQLTYRHHVLITHRPDHSAVAYGVQEMNMGADVAGGMDA